MECVSEFETPPPPIIRYITYSYAILQFKVYQIILLAKSTNNYENIISIKLGWLHFCQKWKKLGKQIKLILINLNDKIMIQQEKSKLIMLKRPFIVNEYLLK